MPNAFFNIKFISKAVLFGAALFLIGCDETESQPLGTMNKNFADRSIIDAFLTYKDSGIVRMELRSPLIEEYTMIDSPYTLMRKGVKVKFWNSSSPDPNFLEANWAKVEDRKKFYEGKGDVEMINNDGDTLRTQHIFWDNKNRRIYSDDTVTIKRKDGTINISYNGMSATEDFKEFTFFNNRGVLMFKEGGNKKQSPTPSTTPNTTSPPPGMTEFETGTSASEN